MKCTPSPAISRDNGKVVINIVVNGGSVSVAANKGSGIYANGGKGNATIGGGKAGVTVEVEI